MEREDKIRVAITAGITAYTPMAEESVPYDTYNYDYWKNIVLTPAPYVPDGAIKGVQDLVGQVAGDEDQDQFLVGLDADAEEALRLLACGSASVDHGSAARAELARRVHHGVREPGVHDADDTLVREGHLVCPLSFVLAGSGSDPSR